MIRRREVREAKMRDSTRIFVWSVVGGMVVTLFVGSLGSGCAGRVAQLESETLTLAEENRELSLRLEELQRENAELREIVQAYEATIEEITAQRVREIRWAKWYRDKLNEYGEIFQQECACRDKARELWRAVRHQSPKE